MQLTKTLKNMIVAANNIEFVTLKVLKSPIKHAVIFPTDIVHMCELSIYTMFRNNYIEIHNSFC